MLTIYCGGSLLIYGCTKFSGVEESLAVRQDRQPVTAGKFANQSKVPPMKVNKLDGFRYALQTRADVLGNVPPSSPIGRFIRNEPVTINALLADLQNRDGYGDLVAPLRDALLHPTQ